MNIITKLQRAVFEQVQTNLIYIAAHQHLLKPESIGDSDKIYLYEDFIKPANEDEVESDYSDLIRLMVTTYHLINALISNDNAQFDDDIKALFEREGKYQLEPSSYKAIGAPITIKLMAYGKEYKLVLALRATTKDR